MNLNLTVLLPYQARLFGLPLIMRPTISSTPGVQKTSTPPGDTLTSLRWGPVRISPLTVPVLSMIGVRAKRYNYNKTLYNLIELRLSTTGGTLDHATRFQSRLSRFTDPAAYLIITLQFVTGFDCTRMVTCVRCHN